MMTYFVMQPGAAGPEGPVEESELRRRIDRGEVSSDTRVARPGASKWLRVTDALQLTTPLPPSTSVRSAASTSVQSLQAGQAAQGLQAGLGFQAKLGMSREGLKHYFRLAGLGVVLIGFHVLATAWVNHSLAAQTAEKKAMMVSEAVARVEAIGASAQRYSSNAWKFSVFFSDGIQMERYDSYSKTQDVCSLTKDFHHPAQFLEGWCVTWNLEADEKNEQVRTPLDLRPQLESL